MEEKQQLKTKQMKLENLYWSWKKLYFEKHNQVHF